MENINDTQLKILSKLLFSPKLRFRDLNAEACGTDLFSYHIRSLTKLALIERVGGCYCLTRKGKMVATKLDTETSKFEKQPKVSVIIVPHKTVRKQEMFLIQQRTKEPYYGYWGFVAGKVRWGETLPETGRRELMEETGLGGDCKFCHEIHEMVYDSESKEMLEDKFFHVVEVSNPHGHLIEKTKEGTNKWVTSAEFLAISPKYHNENDLLNWYLQKDFSFKEEKYYISRF